jgi:antitoxin HigA-1
VPQFEFVAVENARYFGTTPDLWMNLQKNYELDLVRPQLAEAIRQIPQRPPAAARAVSH